MSMRMVSSELTELLESPESRAVMFTEQEVNEYLQQALRVKAEGWMPGVKFERAYVLFEPSVCNIGLEQSVWGYPIYSGVRYNVGVADGNFFAVCSGGNFGRMPIDPRLMKYADVAFKRLWTALQRERDQMNKMQAVQPEKGRITLVTKAAQP